MTASPNNSRKLYLGNDASELQKAAIQTTQANAQLREAINDMWRVLVSELVEKWETNQGSFDFEPYTDEILSLFQTAQQQLLTKLVKQAKIFERLTGERSSGEFEKAVPLTILEAKLKQLRDGEKQ